MKNFLISASCISLACIAVGCSGGTDTSSEGDLSTSHDSLTLSIPGRLEAEDYNSGADGTAYFDTTPGNTGGAYRTDDVDISATTDTGGGNCVGWIAANEWLTYTAQVTEAGTYSIVARVASHSAGTKTLHVEVDGVNVTGPMSFTDATGWQSWLSITAPNIFLAAGSHNIKVVFETAGLNLNYLDFDLTAPASAMARVLPATGALWGYYGSGNSIPDVQAIEGSMGRQLDVVKRYHDFSNNGGSGVFPSSDEKALADAGRVLHYAWETKIYGSIASGMPPVGGTNNTYTYQQITSGQLNAYIDSTANLFKAYGHPFFIDFDHEPDDSTQFSEGSNASRGSAGTPAQFVAAFRYVVERFRTDGVTNAIWVVAYAGFQPNNAVYSELYPGDDVVDMIGNDPYNHTPSKSWTLPPALFHRFYDRVVGGMLGATAAAKPQMLSEYGCSADTQASTQTPNRRPEWMTEIPGALEQMPKYKAAEYFDSSWGLFRGEAASTQGFVTASHDPYVNQTHGH